MSIKVDLLTEFKNAELDDLCQATEAATRDGIGFNWLVPPARELLESYWRGVLVVPERVLFVGKLDHTVAASVQLVKPGPSKQTSAFAVELQAHFVAPWARGHGLAKALVQAAEREASKQGFSAARLSVRATQEAAIRLYEEIGYVRWGTLPAYEFVNGQMLAGHFFYKNLEPVTNLI